MLWSRLTCCACSLFDLACKARDGKACKAAPRGGSGLSAQASHRSGENPAGGVLKGLPKQSDSKKHHAAMYYGEIPPFIKTLRASDASDSTKLAAGVLDPDRMLVREVLGATWAEIDLDAAIWTIPAARLKAKKEHRIPLSKRCLAILTQRGEGAPTDYVFTGLAEGRPLSSMVFLMLLRRMGLKVTTHGFRSAFRMWAAETTNYPREVAEFALAPRTQRPGRGRLPAFRPLYEANEAHGGLVAVRYPDQAGQGHHHLKDQQRRQSSIRSQQHYTAYTRIDR
jgi:Phage integrase family